MSSCFTISSPRGYHCQNLCVHTISLLIIQRKWEDILPFFKRTFHIDQSGHDANIILIIKLWFMCSAAIISDVQVWLVCCINEMINFLGANKSRYKNDLKQSWLLLYKEEGHERSNGPKTLHICLGENLSMEIKNIENLNIIPKSHQFSILGVLPTTKWTFPT